MEIPPNGKFTAVSAGWDHACGLRTNGIVDCWGGNEVGQASAPVGEFIAISAGAGYTCGLQADGTARCWGDSGDDEATPPGGQFVAISAGEEAACGLRTDGTVACWGNKFKGQLQAPGGTFATVSVGARHACGLRANGTAVCWGDDYEGQLQALGGTFATVSAGIGHTCGLYPDGTVACWGYNEQGQADALGGQFSAVSAGGFHACGLRTDGTVECWGGRPYASEGVSWPRVDGHPPAGKVVKKVTVLMPPSTDTYLAEWQRGAREQGEALGFDVTIVENNFDQAEQDLQVQQALSGDLPDMFVWWPVDNAAGVASLKAMSESGVPVMQINQLPVPEAAGFWDLYAGVDDVLNGRVSGELLIELRDNMVADGVELNSEGGNVLVVMFPAGYSAGADRLIGFKEATANAGMTIIDQVEIGFDETSGYNAGLSLIPANRDKGIDLVYAENDALASGMILALEEAGYEPGVNVGVVGGTCHGNLTDLEDGGQYATGLQSPRLEGVQAMLTADLYFTNPTITDGEYRASDDPNAIPDQDQLYTNNFIPNPAVYGSDIEETRLWGFTMEELCAY